MKYEDNCSAVVYRMRYDRPEYLAVHKGGGRYSFPHVRIEKKERKEDPDRAEIGGKLCLEVKPDTVFRDSFRISPESGRAEVVYAAEAVWGVFDKPEMEEASPEWADYERLSGRMTDEDGDELLKHAAAYLAVKKGLRNPVEESGYIRYREHAADIHGHIIPRADDGAQSEQETMELLRLDREEGIQWAFATPHYGIENGYAPDKDMVHEKFCRLAEFLFQSGSPIKSLLGTEWYCAEDIVERIRKKEAFPMGSSDWYMVEFLEWGNVTESGDVMLRRLKKMKDAGIKTILAHPERYTAIQEDWDLAKRICDMGVRLQVNAYDLYLNKNDDTKNLARWMAKEQLISFIGSDMHGTRSGKRPPKMKEGIRWLYENVDDEYANEIVRINAERYLGVERLPG